MPKNFLLSVLIMFGIGVATFAALWARSILSKTTPAEKLVALEKEVKPKGGEVFQTELLGKPVAFLLLDCEVFLLDPSGDQLKKDRVLKTDFYLGPLVCTGSSIDKQGDYLTVYLANRAIGAGGGNTTGGNYRSQDGVAWEKKEGASWRPVV